MIMTDKGIVRQIMPYVLIFTCALDVYKRQVPIFGIIFYTVVHAFFVPLFL